MKIIVLLLFSAISLQALAQDRKIEIAPFKTALVDCPDDQPQDVHIQNTSAKGIVLSVVDIVSGEQLKGFGLGARADADLSFGPGQSLRLKNNSMKPAVVNLSFTEQKPAPLNDEPTGQYIKFSLINNTLRSIPLVIPGVMNPNLSPLSSSGVSLKIGQEIFFRQKGKETLLLVVSKDIKEGEQVNVALLIKKEKKRS